MPRLAGRAFHFQSRTARRSKTTGAANSGFSRWRWNQARPSFDDWRAARKSNHRAIRNHGVLRNDDDAVADVVALVVEVFRLAGGRDGHVIADARIFINDGILNFAIFTDAQARFALALVAFDGVLRLVIIAADHDDPVQLRARADQRAQADDGAVDDRMVDDAAIGNDGMINLRRVFFCPAQ